MRCYKKKDIGQICIYINNNIKIYEYKTNNYVTWNNSNLAVKIIFNKNNNQKVVCQFPLADTQMSFFFWCFLLLKI